MTTELAPVLLVQDKPYDVLSFEEEDELLPLSPDEWPDVSHIVTEDDTPVDNLPSAKNQRLLVEPLYSSWSLPVGYTSFLADANVGIFYMVKQRPLVPDVFLSLNVQVPDNWWEKRHRSYFVWEFGKPPDVVIEIVSNRKGGEDSLKLRLYAEIGVDYYVIYDPQDHLGQGILRVFELHGGIYDELPATWMPRVGLGVALWHGEYEGKEDTWLRWCDEHGVVIPTGKERAEEADQRAEQALQEKEQALLIAEQERTEKEQALLIAEQERTEKERALQEKQELARMTARNLLPLLDDEQISHATGLSLDEVRSLR